MKNNLHKSASRLFTLLMMLTFALGQQLAIGQTCFAPNQCNPTPGFPNAPASAPGATAVITETFDTGFGIFTENNPPGPGTIGNNELTLSTNGDTPSGGTGPETTPGCNGSANDGEFIFLESSIPTNSTETHCMTANIPLPAASPSIATPYALSFWYYMFGDNTGTLEVFVNGTSEFSVTGEQQTANCQPWLQGDIDVSALAGTTITVQVCMREGAVGGTFESDIAIDHFQVFATAVPCTITCPADITVNNDPGICGANVNILGQAGAACSATPITNDFTNDASTSAVFPVGTTTVTLSATDNFGNAVTCSYDVTVVDAEGPTFTSCPSNQTINLAGGACDAVVNYVVEAIDNCGATVGGPGGSLTTTFAGGNGFAGNMFDVTNLGTDPITFDSYEIHLTAGTTNDIEVYITTTANTWVGNNLNAAAWTLIGTQTGVTSAGANTGTLVTIPGATLAPGETRGLYVTSTTNNMDYTNGTNTYTDGTLQIVAGQGGGYPFNLNNASRTWNGTINYSIVGGGGGAAGAMQTAGLPSGSTFPVGTTTNTFVATDAVGNSVTCSFDVTVEEFTPTGGGITVNPTVQTSLDPSGACTIVTSDEILEGNNYGCYDNFIITRTPAVAAGFGCPTGPNYLGGVPVTCADIGRPVRVTITDPLTGNSQWSTIIVEDKTAPVIENCEDLTVGCNFDVNFQGVQPGGVNVAAIPAQTTLPNGADADYTGTISGLPSTATITGVEVFIDATATDINDFIIRLIHPDGTEVDLFAIVGGGNAAVCQNAANFNVTFNDAGPATPICVGAMGPMGLLAPQEPLSVLNGKPAVGDYILQIENTFATDMFTLNSAEIRVTTGDINFGPTVTDNCPGVTVTTTISTDNADCAGDGTIIRTYVATDASGNTATCSQTITVELPELADVEFPANLDGISGPMLECTSAYPAIGARVSLTETRTFTPGTAIVNGGSIQIPVVVTGFPADAQIEDLDISLDIAYSTSGDLIIDYGRQFDANPTSLLANVCDGGNDILATLDDAGFAQYDCATFDPSLKGTFQPNGSLADFNGESPNGTFFLYVEDFDGTGFDFGSVDGITLSVTYSTATLITAPTIGGLPFDQLDCQINMTMDDTVIDVCPTSYKVRRRFTVINMCTGEDIIVNQIIAVQDQDAPIVACPRSELDNPIDLVALSNQGYQNPTSGYGVCLGDIVVPPVTVLSDNCSGVGSVTTELFAADGTQIGSVSGNGGTFRELPLDDGIFTGALNEPSIRYSVRYIVEDNCNNQETVEVFYNVVERTAPVANCDEITNVSLTGTDTTFVNASVFDDGSYDICSDIHFYVRRMQPTNDLVAYGNYFESIRLKTFVPFKFRERVAFTCDDQNVMLYFLVVDDFVQGYIDEYVNVIIPGLPAAVRNNPNTPYTIWPDGTFYLSTFPGIGGETKDLWQGHYNICMVDVEVEDKVAPVKLLDAPDRTIVCTNDALRQQYLDDQNVTFDAPIFQDNCDFTVSLQIIDGTTTCGDGTIRRRFQATDVNGNMSILCEQRITSVLEHDYTILWPRDEDRNMCVAGVLGDTLSRPNSLIEDGCDLLAVSYVDARFQTNDDACYKILRTYDVINWCEWDGVANAILIPNSTFTTQGPRLDVVISQAGAQNVQINFNPSTIRSVGRWSYVQQIKVYDEEDPTLGTITQAPCEAGNVVDDVAGFGCGQAVSVNFELTDNCGGLTPPTYRLVAFTGDVNGDGQISAAELANGTSFANDPFAGVLSAPAGSTSSVAQSGTFTITGTYPLGDHVFVVSVTDLCGNAAEYYIPFTAEDCKEPTPKAISFITIDLMATGMVPCTPAHIDNGSFDGCGPVKLSFSADVNDTLAVFTCADLGTNPVQLWVTDAAGNQDFVDVDIIIQDNLNACGTSTTPRIAASLTTAGGVGVQGATVNLSGDATMSDATDVNGVTGFDVTAGGDYTVSALLDSDPANGVTTYDLYLIGQHILGVTDLTTFSQLTAADANANGSVSAFDMTVIRRVILGLDQNFRNNTSWRFFNANNNASEVVSFNDVQAQVAADFIAVKTGDVNATARANSRQALAPRTLVGEFALVANDAVLAAGETQVVSFNASEAALGYQLTLEWDANALEVVSVNGGAHNAADFGKHLLANGKLTMSHNGSMEGELFSLEVRALRDGVALSEVMSAGSSVTTAEAYGTEGTKSVALRFGGSVAGAGNALEQNRPNPFAGTTQIGFTLAEAGAASLIVTDVTGRVVWRTAGQFDAGHSQVEIAAGDLPAAGLLNYTLIAGDFTATRKMVVIK